MSTSFLSGAGGGGSFKSTSTSTKVVNGKRIVTKRFVSHYSNCIIPICVNITPVRALKK